MPLPKPKKKRERIAIIDEEPEETVQEDDEPAPSSNLIELDGDALSARIHKMLKLSTFEPPIRYWLNVGSPEMNSVFGSRDHGIPYGKMVEISGLEHCGKTLISTVFMGMAQQDGAGCGYLDFEDSRDEVWATKLGVHWPSVLKFYPELVIDKPRTDEQQDKAAKRAKTAKEKKEVARRSSAIPRLLSAEQVFELAERGMHVLAQQGIQKQFWFVDSIAGIETAKQQDVGAADSNMNSKLDRAAYLSTLLPHWTALAANYNACVFFSNQLRSRVGGFIVGDPNDTTGGRALRHFCHVRVRGVRIKGGRLKQGKAIIGLAGKFFNVKNKSGGGSSEGTEWGFKILWNRPKALVTFISPDDLKEEMGGE